MFIYTETHSPEWTYPEFRLLSEMCFSISVYYYIEIIVCQLNLDKLNSLLHCV